MKHYLAKTQQSCHLGPFGSAVACAYERITFVGDRQTDGVQADHGKIELGRLANELGLVITVHHLPAGHEQVELDRASAVFVHHRKLARQTAGQPPSDRPIDRCHNDENWSNIRHRCEHDPNTYPASVKVPGAELEAVDLVRHEFHGEWNYKIRPRALALER